MKKGLILTNAFYITKQTEHQMKRFQEEFQQFAVTIDVQSNLVLPAWLQAGTIQSNLQQYDFILFLDKDKHIAMMLEKAGFTLFNSAQAIATCDDKMLTYIALANQGIMMPKTIASPLLYPHVNDHDFLEKIDQAFSYPIVVKECFGSLGKQVYKADNFLALQTLRSQLKHLPHLYQELIQSSYGKDVRVVVVGGQVVASMQRVSAVDFRSNIANGGKGYPFRLPKTYQEAAEKIAKLLALDYGGIDFLIGPEQEPILCEVNSNAFFQEIEQVTGVNVARYYVKHIYQKIYGGE